MPRNQRVKAFRLTLGQDARIRYWGNYLLFRQAAQSTAQLPGGSVRMIWSKGRHQANGSRPGGVSPLVDQEVKDKGTD